jgi:putative ABC transport system permease protein
MLKHYALVLFRNLRREAGYSLINVLGLALALACCLMLTLYIRSELSYDQHNVDHERIYRVINEFNTNGQVLRSAASSPALGPLISRTYPQAADFVRLQSLGRNVFRSESAELYWDDVLLADPSAFRVFTHDAVYGSLEGALDEPSSIAISESFARQHFGDRNPLGETIRTDSFDYQVTAVFADLPDNSHLKYSALISRKRLDAVGQGDDNLSPARLHGINLHTYFKTPEGTDGEALTTLLNDYYDKEGAPFGERFNMSITYEVQPLADVHFGEGLSFDQPTGNIFYIYGFAAVALFILLVACINYTNLAVARATKRAKEVGMRKVIGASKRQIVAQFLGESLFYSLVALILAIIMVEALEAFTGISQLLGKAELLNLSAEPGLAFALLLFALVVGLAAGAYPAFFLSAISPLAALTSLRKSRGQRFSVAKGLVFVQFFVSVAVLACTLLMALQMSYVASKPLGFERDARLTFALRGVDMLEQAPVIRSELLRSPAIVGVAQSSFVPGGGVPINAMTIENQDGQVEPTSVWNMQVGHDFVSVMGMQMAGGRDFSRDIETDVTQAVIVNETLVRRMGWTDPLGKRVVRGEQTFRVVGVVRDFHFASLHQEVEPMVMTLVPPPDFSRVPPAQRNAIGSAMVAHLAPGQIAEGLAHLEAVMTRFDPTHPFEYRFFDDDLNEMYQSEANLMTLTGIFAGICIFVSCLGLFGLSAFTTEQRSKEIGVRKVLGASTGQIVLMLARGQMLLVAVAAVLASAVSYWVISDWLTAFSYRTDIAWWVFVVATFMVGLVAFATLALQSSRTAQANPVKALRFE